MKSTIVLVLGLALWGTAGCGTPEAVPVEGGTGADLGTPPADAVPADGPAAGDGPGAGVDTGGMLTEPLAIPPAEQRQGDPAAGRDALLNKAVVTCGIPSSLYDRYFGASGAGPAVEGRTGRNAQLPYILTAHTTPSGVEVVTPNCLSCHATIQGGEVVIGLGNNSFDFTADETGALQTAAFLVSDPTEKMEFQKFIDRTLATAPYVRPDTVGANPADNLAAIIFSHRDPETLAWSDTPLIDPPPEQVVPVDVPPWWRMKKKNAMFYTAAGRGDHSRIFVTASTLCTDTVEEARTIDDFAPDLRAFILTLEPPAYPFPIDSALAQSGEQVYNRACASCHGTYGSSPSYPNLVIPVQQVGTDPLLALGASQLAQRFVDWFNNSFYGEMSSLKPEKGYIAPPLDGIWVTGPFLHNGSVPTLAALLDSSKRPTYFQRSYNADELDQKEVGTPYTVLDHGKAGETNADRRKLIYDTTELGYSNAGHTYGDRLSDEDRRSLLEYLKTL